MSHLHLVEKLERCWAQLKGNPSTDPVCFGPCIQNEPFPDKFSLPRDTPKYDSSMKPEDWLTDYATAVAIAHGNKRTAVRYVPLMLTGSARTWLNSLAPNSINAWPDFEKVFVRNFNGTYKRPGCPRDLALCVQGDRETDREYLAKWTELRNTCEGILESQAISFFIEGC